MQGTQYAPRESILCMEHFVALQCIISLVFIVLNGRDGTESKYPSIVFLSIDKTN